MELLIDIAVILVPLVGAYFVGSFLEKKHFDSIRKREEKWLRVPAITFEKSFPHPHPIKKAKLVTGSVVVSVDYFKRFLAGWRNLFGGEMKSYASIIDRGRREAILRMKQSAPNADAFINCRLETSSISKGGKKNKIGCAEVLCYGTAVFYDK